MYLKEVEICFKMVRYTIVFSRKVGIYADEMSKCQNLSYFI